MEIFSSHSDIPYSVHLVPNDEEDAFDILDGIWSYDMVGFDTETYGLGLRDKPFALIFATFKHVFYFNFYDGEDCFGKKIDPRYVCGAKTLKGLQRAFDACPKDFTIMIHNAVYDLERLEQMGLRFRKDQQIVCTYATSKLINNQRRGKGAHSLKAVAGRHCYAKDDRVEKFIADNNLYDENKSPKFYKVPLDVMMKYAAHDAWLHLMVGEELFLIMGNDDSGFTVFDAR